MPPGNYSTGAVKLTSTLTNRVLLEGGWALNVERRDSHIGGWTSLFNKLAAYAAKQQEQRT